MRWEEYTLGELANIARGGSPRPIKEFLTEELDGVNWIKISDATASGKFIEHTKQKIRKEGVSRSRMVYPGDFLLSNSMSFGRPYIMNTTGAIHDGWLVFQDIVDSVSSDFLYHLLVSKLVGDQFEEKASGSTVRNLNIDRVKSVHVPIPPLEEQERIVEVLDEAFAAIDKAKVNIERNLTNARELFQSRLNDIFSNPSEDWVVKPLGEVCAFKSGGTPSKSKPQLWGDGIPWISSKDMKFDLILETQDSVTLEAVGQGTRAVKPGTLLIVVRSGILMRKIPIALTGVDATFNQDIKALIVNSELSSEFLFWFLKGSEPTLLTLVTRSATVHRLETSVLTSFQIPIPESQEQEAIVKTASLLNRLKKELEIKYQSELDNLEELRQSILEQAFEGKLTEPVAA